MSVSMETVKDSLDPRLVSTDRQKHYVRSQSDVVSEYLEGFKFYSIKFRGFLHKKFAEFV